MSLRSTYQAIGLPEDFGPILLTLCVILLLAPYASGADFGILKIPVFPPTARRRLKVLGPVAMVAAILLFVPFWPEKAPETEVAANTSDSTSRAIPPGPDTSRQVPDTASDTTKGVVAPPPPPPPPPPAPPPSGANTTPPEAKPDTPRDGDTEPPPPVCIWLARPGVHDLVAALIQQTPGVSYESDSQWIVRARSLVHSAPAIVPRQLPHLAQARIDDREVQLETVRPIAETLYDALLELETFHTAGCG